MILNGTYKLAPGTYKMFGKVFTRTSNDEFRVDVLQKGQSFFAMINGDYFKQLTQEEWDAMGNNLTKVR